MSPTELQRCPVCGRDLTGLPPPGRCPDCGFEYDQHTQVWRTGESWVRLAFMYAAIGAALGLIIAVLYRIGYRQVPNPALVLVLVLIAPALGLLFRRVVGGRISGRFVALTPGGILVCTRGRPLLIPWDDVERIRDHRGTPRILRKSTATYVIVDDIFTGPDEVAAFRNAATEAIRRHKHPPRT